MSIPIFGKILPSTCNPNSCPSPKQEASNATSNMDIDISKSPVVQFASAYKMFTLIERPKVLSHFGNLSDHEVDDEIAKRWNNLDEGSKEKLEVECITAEEGNPETTKTERKTPKKHNVDKNIVSVDQTENVSDYFSFLFFNWRSVATPNSDQSGKVIQDILWKQWIQTGGKDVLSGGTKKSKKIKDPSEPKRAPSAFILYTSSQRAELIKNNPGIAPKNVLVELGKMWSLLEEKDKEPFVIRSNELKVAYNAAVEEWKKIRKEN